jgi:hypothetical protein
LKKINKIVKPLANMTKMSRERSKLVKSEIKQGDNNKHNRNPGNHQRVL